jgi:hypothetical protein
MIKMKANLQLPTFDKGRYKALLESVARALLSQAISEYIVTAQSIIPVWTGASVLTLTKLASLVGMPLVATPTGSAAERPNLVSKTQARGVASSGGSLKISNGLYSFSYHTGLPHLVYNEHNNANVDRPPELFSELKNPGPYNFQEHTKAAVTVVLKQFVLPDPRDSITIQKVSV